MAASFAYGTTAAPVGISKIETVTNTVVATINLGDISEIAGLAVTPNGARAYVATNDREFHGAIKVLDTAANTVMATIRNGFVLNGITIAPNGKRAYVTDDHSLFAIDTTTNSVVAAVQFSTCGSGDRWQTRLRSQCYPPSRRDELAGGRRDHQRRRCHDSPQWERGRDRPYARRQTALSVNFGRWRRNARTSGHRYSDQQGDNRRGAGDWIGPRGRCSPRWEARILPAWRRSDGDPLDARDDRHHHQQRVGQPRIGIGQF